MQRFNSDKAPKALGPYSQATIHNGIIYLSGMLAIDPTTGEFISKDIQLETDRVIKNIAILLNEANSSLDNVIKNTLFIKNMDDFQKINEVYSSYFNEQKPSRSCVEVARLPKDMNIEIETIALIN